MKICLFFLLVSLLFSTSAFGELSAQDFEKLNAMFKESEARLRAEIAASEKRTREFVSQEIAKLTVRMDERDRRVATEFQAINNRIDDTNSRFDDVNNRLNLNLTLLIALLGLIGVALGLPYLQDKKKERAQEEKIAAQQQQIEEQQKQLAAQQQLLETQQQQLAAQQQLLETQQRRMDTMETELKTLKQNQMPSA